MQSKPSKSRCIYVQISLYVQNKNTNPCRSQFKSVSLVKIKCKKPVCIIKIVSPRIRTSVVSLPVSPCNRRFS
jgi:hypothetical protein